MSHYFIFRTAKIKSKSQFHSAVKHHYRIGGLKNSDETRRHLNQELFTAEECKNRFESFFGKNGKFEKRRKDAVLGIDYLITASPDFFNDKSTEEAIKFLEEAAEIIKQKHGKNNVLLQTIELDETTPHLTMIVVPVDKNNGLNCKSFLGNKTKLRQIQDEFYEKLKPNYPTLKRGEKVEETRATRKTLKEFYKEVNLIKEKILNDDFNILEKSDNEKIRTIYDLKIENEKLKREISNLKTKFKNNKNNDLINELNELKDEIKIRDDALKQITDTAIKLINKKEISTNEKEMIYEIKQFFHDDDITVTEQNYAYLP